MSETVDTGHIVDEIPDYLAETFGWDNRKRLLDVFYEGCNADHLQDEDEFHRRYGGLIAVARYAMWETLAAVKQQADLIVDTNN